MGDGASAPSAGIVRKKIWGGIGVATCWSHSDQDGYESVNGRHSMLNNSKPSQMETWPKSVEGSWQRVLLP